MQKYEVFTTVSQEVSVFGRVPTLIKEPLKTLREAESTTILLLNPLKWVAAEAYTLFALVSRFGLCLPSCLNIASTSPLESTVLFSPFYLAYSPKHTQANSFIDKLEGLDAVAFAQAMKETAFHPYPLPPQWCSIKANVETIIEVSS